MKKISVWLRNGISLSVGGGDACRLCRRGFKIDGNNEGGHPLQWLQLEKWGQAHRQRR